MTELIFTLSYVNCSTVCALKVSTTRIFAYCGCPSLLSDTATITLVLLVPRPRFGTVPTGGRVALDSMSHFLGDELLVMQPSVPVVASVA